jgi:hypothetical protein
LCAAPPPRRASASSPPLPHPPEVVSDAVTHRVRASVGLEALDFQPPGARRVSTGAGPQAGPCWRTARRASPRTRPDAPPPRPASARPSESRAPPCHDIDQLGCRLRYRDLREAGVSEVLRQLPQFANGAHLHALDGPALRSATPAALLCREGGIYLSQVGFRHGRSTAGDGGDLFGSVGRGRPGCGLAMRLR